MSQDHKYTLAGTEQAPRKMLTGFIDVIIFGLALKWGSNVSFWHYGLTHGFREYIIAFCIMAVGYTMLGLCLAEMVSVVAFPGGYYGYARCCIHPIFGYWVGINGVIEATFTTAATIVRLAQAITSTTGSSLQLEPLWWVLIYGVAIAIISRHHKVYWCCIWFLAGCSIIIFAIFIFGSLPVVNFPRWSNIPDSSVDFFSKDFLEMLVLPSIFLFGIDLMVALADDIQDSKRVIPKAMLLAYALMAVLAVTLIMTTVSQWPGLKGGLFSVVFPLSFGFKSILHITLDEAVFYIFPAMASSMMAYMFFTSRLISHMALSNLLPSVLKPTNVDSNNSSPQSMMAAASIGLCIQAVAWTYDTGISFRTSLHAAFFVYLSMFACYIVFKRKYSHLPREFTNPLGIPGAVLGFVIFTLAIASMFMSAINNIASYIYVTCIGLFAIYYALFADGRQKFSQSEQQSFFKVYIINMNSRRRSRKSVLRTSSWRWPLFNWMTPGAAIDPSDSQLTSSGRKEEEVAACQASTVAVTKFVDSCRIGANITPFGDSSDTQPRILPPSELALSTVSAEQEMTGREFQATQGL